MERTLHGDNNAIVLKYICLRFLYKIYLITVECNWSEIDYCFILVVHYYYRFFNACDSCTLFYMIHHYFYSLNKIDIIYIYVRTTVY